VNNETIEHECTNNLVCPYCGVELSDSYEYFGLDSEVTEVECECGKTFVAVREVSVTYSTRKQEAKEA